MFSPLLRKSPSPTLPLTQSRLASPHTINPTKADNSRTHSNRKNTRKTQSNSRDALKYNINTNGNIEIVYPPPLTSKTSNHEGVLEFGKET